VRWRLQRYSGSRNAAEIQTSAEEDTNPAEERSKRQCKANAMKQIVDFYEPSGQALLKSRREAGHMSGRSKRQREC